MNSWTPLEYRCVVRLDPVEEMTAGGIIVPQQVQDQESMAQVHGTLVDMSDMAFTDIENKKWKCEVPELGDKVMIAKFAGLVVKEDEDGVQVEYRLINDKDVVAFKRSE